VETYIGPGLPCERHIAFVNDGDDGDNDEQIVVFCWLLNNEHTACKMQLSVFYCYLVYMAHYIQEKVK